VQSFGTKAYEIALSFVESVKRQQIQCHPSMEGTWSEMHSRGSRARGRKLQGSLQVTEPWL
jgi:hypothetical protein